MREMVHKINRQLKQEKISTKENQTKIVELEKKIIALGIDPKDPTAMGELVKQKDTKIKVLRKRLNLPKSQHVQTPKLQANHEEKE
jgi:hypothetical protein